MIVDIGTSAYPDASGISLGQSVRPFSTEIFGNTILRTGGHGIVINGMPRGITVKGNTIIDPGKNNVSTIGVTTGATGTELAIERNIIRLDNARDYHMTYGIALAGFGHWTNVVKDNAVTGAAKGNVSARWPTRQ